MIDTYDEEVRAYRAERINGKENIEIGGDRFAVPLLFVFVRNV
ncbi:hypothetical protein [Marinisporobacter balticus]|uniref:Uncharacterized protein n=1 Tax=Marinisporobacter balticus TaxID=2018667 RepID=A0A4R2KZH1_9FIRM|nr:hypothetical protein [Marinisporobacter balticus]TCO76849.1 hypothetical protein EV214_1075 [Marinisporobacter balticus]